MKFLLPFLLAGSVTAQCVLTDIRVSPNQTNSFRGYDTNGFLMWFVSSNACPYRVEVDFIAASNTVWLPLTTIFDSYGCKTSGWCFGQPPFVTGKPITGTGQTQTFVTGSPFPFAGYYFRRVE